MTQFLSYQWVFTSKSTILHAYTNSVLMRGVENSTENSLLLLNYAVFDYTISESQRTVQNKEHKKTMEVHERKTSTSFSNLFVIYLFVFFLFIIQLTKAKKASNTSLLYSFPILSVFISL